MRSRLLETNSRFRAALLANDNEASRALVERYARAWEQIDGQLTALTEKINEARANGEELGVDWLYRSDRLVGLLRQIEEQIRAFAAAAEARTLTEQYRAVELATNGAVSLMRDAAPGILDTFNALHVSAVTDLVGFTADGSPLADLFADFGPSAAASAKEALVSAFVAGKHPYVIARDVRQATGTSLWRARTIARTESLRAYRTATQRAYQANADVVEGWVWVAALGRRTCPACWAMHGTKHALDQPLDGHPNCRCTAIPYTKSWEELGISGVDETRVEVPSGEALFDKLPDADKLAILGKAAFAEYQAGRVSLADFAGHKHNPSWGSMRYTRSLKAALAEAGAAPAAPRAQKPAAPPAIRKAPHEMTGAELIQEFDRAAKDIEALIARAEEEAQQFEEAGFAVLRRMPAIIRERTPEQQAEIDKAMDAAAAAVDRLMAAKARRDTYAYDLLKVQAPITIDSDLPKRDMTTDSQRLRRATREGLAFVQTVTSATPKRSNVRIYVGEAYGRACFKWWENKVILYKHNSPAVAAHELGHWLEDNIPNAKAAVTAFLDRRTAGETPQRLRDITGNRNYDRSEIAKPDKFRDPYIGKIYTRGDTEVLSMGLQYLKENPLAFAREDPEHFALTVDILRGHI